MLPPHLDSLSFPLFPHILFPPIFKAEFQHHSLQKSSPDLSPVSQLVTNGMFQRSTLPRTYHIRQVSWQCDPHSCHPEVSLCPLPLDLGATALSDGAQWK